MLLRTRQPALLIGTCRLHAPRRRRAGRGLRGLRLDVPAFGVLLVAYILGQLGGLIPIPGGIGGVDGGLIGVLVLYGVDAADAAVAVIAYRGVLLAVPAVLGFPALAILRRRLRAERHDIAACAPGDEVEVLGRGHGPQAPAGLRRSPRRRGGRSHLPPSRGDVRWKLDQAGSGLRRSHRRRRQLVLRLLPGHLPDVREFQDVFPGQDTKAFVLAMVSALLFFGSILLHELGHALTARGWASGSTSIDLWLFGGLAKMERDTRTAGRGVQGGGRPGPVVTLVIAVVCFGAATLLDGLDGAARAHGARRGRGRAGRWPCWAGWRWSTLSLLLFNLIPGFPLDGGRIARAIAWWLHRRPHRAPPASPPAWAAASPT